MVRVKEGARFSGPAVEAADSAYLTSLVHARDLGAWQRSTRWLKEFEDYAKVVYKQSGLFFDLSDAMASNELMRVFLSSVVAQDKGHSVPGSARRFLNAERLRRGLPSLNEDAIISNLLAGAVRRAPRTKKQAAPLHEDEVNQLLEGFNSSWVETQVATMAGLGFLTVMRGVELRTIRTEGVRFVLKSGTHVDASKCGDFPSLTDIRAILFHVPWRKQHQAKDVWVPLACPKMWARIIGQLEEGRRQFSPQFLFPSKNRKGVPGMNPRNPIGRAQFQRELQRGLVDVCGFEANTARLFTGHCMRLGGSNYMRRLGLDDEIHRKLGGWMSIKSSQGYMVLSPREQAIVCEKMALSAKRTCAFSESELDGMMDKLTALTL
jgi:integrase